MKLSDLLQGQADVRLKGGNGDLEISGLTADSRQVRAGMLFAALAGAHVDGVRFVPDALAAGAAAVLSEQRGLDLPAGVALLETANPRAALAHLAARFFAHQPEIVAAVTGTNGKTSVADFLRQIWQNAGHRSASLGTLGVRGDEDLPAAPAALTTLDPVSLHALLADLAAAKVRHLALEASSHGLDQNRLDGVRLTAAGFTNLTRDHLDYHGTMDAYRNAKLRLFTELLPAGGTAVINSDGVGAAVFAQACSARGLTVMTVGEAGADLTLARRQPTGDGQSLRLSHADGQSDLHLPLAGAFQAQNALLAAGLAIACGLDRQHALAALESLVGAPGRLERIGRSAAGAEVYIDYAHTPDALTTVLEALAPHAAGDLHVVFGAGGDRDAGKRPLMGAAATAGASHVYVTDDNPRTEDATAIRQAILAAAPGAREIADRRAAIAAAIESAGPGDVVLIAGKGHETGQIIGEEILPFDDGATAREILSIAGEGPESGAHGRPAASEGRP